MQCKNHAGVEATRQSNAHRLLAGKVPGEPARQRGTQLLVIAVGVKRRLLFPFLRSEIGALILKLLVPELPNRATGYDADSFENRAILQNTTERRELT